MCYTKNRMMKIDKEDGQLLTIAIDIDVSHCYIFIIFIEWLVYVV